MKKLLLGATALTLLFSACKKDDTPTGPSNYIKIGSETYNVTGFTPIANAVAVSGGSGSNSGSITFSFGTGAGAPSSGTYKVVEDATASNEVELSVGRFNGTTTTGYGSIGTSTVNVTVATDGGKMSISMPEVQVKQLIGGTETITVSANAKQL